MGVLAHLYFEKKKTHEIFSFLFCEEKTNMETVQVVCGQNMTFSALGVLRVSWLTLLDPLKRSQSLIHCVDTQKNMVPNHQKRFSYSLKCHCGLWRNPSTQVVCLSYWNT